MTYRSILIMAICVVMIGCASETTTRQDPAEVQLEKDEELDDGGRRAPLTGLAVNRELDHPVIMAVINNHTQARPQTGLHRADIVFEILAEGDITRFAALYHSQAEGTIGPIRSARPYILDLAEGFDAVVAHAGGSPAAKERFGQTGYPSLDGIAAEETLYWREDSRQPPHNLYTSIEALIQGAEEKGFADRQAIPPLVFAEAEGADLAGVASGQVNISYGSSYEVSYAYDDAQNQYIRYTLGETHVDLDTQEPLSIDNVLIIKAAHDVVDEQGRRDIDLLAGGAGWLLQRGQVQEIEWQYENGFPRPYADGEELPLIPGRTWVNVIPDDGEVRY